MIVTANLAWAVLGVLPLLAAGPADRPNVLVIIADDLNVSLGCYGHPVVKSPALDRLAARGVRFDRAYCQYPYCNPTRASLLTGLRPGTTRVVNNSTHFRKTVPDVVTLPQLFRRNGYFTARVGKVYHMGVPEDVVAGTAGLDDPASWETAINPVGKEHQSPGKGSNQTPQYNLEKSSSTGFFCLEADGDGQDQADFRAASAAIRLLEQKRDRPFFLAIGFVRPHVPLVAPRRYFDLYPPEKVRPVQGPPDDRADIPAPALTGKLPDWGMSAEQRRQTLRGYYASISFLDAQAGRLLDALDRLKLTESTVVVFLGDHGYHLGEHQLWQKQTLFEQSARVPLLVAAPGVKGNGRASAGLVELVDIFPTVADLCGLKAPGGLEGTSFRPLLDDPGRRWKKAAFTEVSRGRVTGRSARTEQWRYTEWTDTKGQVVGRELYDHQADPGEHSNVAEDARHAETAAGLGRLLREGWKAAAPESK